MSEWYGGRYEVIRSLGSGSAADAFEARDALNDDRVTLKVLRDPTVRGSFGQEFQRLRGLQHPSLPVVRDFARARIGGASSTYYVADFIEGETLAETNGTLSSTALTTVVTDCLRGLAFLHALGIRHGDVSAHNIIVRAGHAVLIDFGCASGFGVPATISGTPATMAPEVLGGAACDGRADVYSLARTIVLWAERHHREAPPVCARMTAERPEDRPTAEDALLELGCSPPLGPPLGRSAGLVGRESELVVLHEAIETCAAGKPTEPIAIRGSRGVGRTRLLREAKWHAQAKVPVVELRGADGPWGALESLLQTGLPAGYEGWCVGVERAREAGLAFVTVCDDLSVADAERLVAVLRPEDSVLPIVVSEAEWPTTIDLQPLPVDTLAVWVPEWSPADVLKLHESTAGFPAEVEAAVASVSAGHQTPMDLRATSTLPLPETERLRTELARVAVGLAADSESSVALQRSGWVVGDRLRRSGDVSRLQGALGAEMTRAHVEALRAGVDAPARRVWHLHGAGRDAEALQLARDSSFDAAPDAWREALEGWAPGLLAARALRVAGRPDRALARLRQAPNEASHEWQLEVALAHLGVGDGTAAERHARAALEVSAAATGTPEQADASDALARALLRCARYEEARECARRALEDAPLSHRPGLSERIGVASIYLGDLATARRALSAAERTHASPRELIRLRTYQAIAAFRSGDLASADTAYRAARQLAEARGLSDLLAIAAMNEATVLQQLGDWGGALRGYERALRLARALGRTSTASSLRFNLANLNVAIGRAESAHAHLAALGETTPDVQVAVWLVEAELHRLRDETGKALAAATRSMELAQQNGQERERLEARILRLELGTCTEADAREVVADAEANEAKDMLVRAHALRANAMSRAGDAAGALKLLEQTLHLAREVGERDRIALLCAQCARIATASGGTDLAERYRSEAQSIWERIALTLEPAMRDSFWRHPSRAMPRANTERTTSDDTLRRLLQLNKRINSSLSTNKILEHAIDAAIELAEAERGFVLLADPDDRLRVAVARNLDRERIGRSRLKFSHSIAEEVLRGGRPIVTNDARTDARFAEQRSVHAMRLTSVVCVPIESPRGQLGALYLDHRFRPSRFDDSDVDVLQALADQVAIALDNAALTEALEKRSRELEREKSKVETLLEEREAELAVGRAELQRLRGSAPTGHDYRPLIGQSESMRKVFALLDRVVGSNLSVLILGESGTGKELVARAIHRLGSAANAPMMSVNCAAVPETLLESELFGHRRGAFTGADRDKDGLFVGARGGIVFLDEVGEMPMSMQAKLLRVLQEREVRPLGSTQSIPVDFRLLAATNRDLKEQVAKGAFREDLYYRLAVVEVELPSLRERRSDLPLLVDAILERLAEEHRREVPKLDREALRRLQLHDWPGNVRELENVLARALVLGGKTIGAEDLGLTPGARSKPRTRKSFREGEVERIAAMLELTGWNVSEAARRLGMPRNTLYRRMKKHGLHR